MHPLPDDVVFYLEDVYCFNAHSLVNKLHEFHLFVSNVKPALVAVVESWFKTNLSDSLLCPKDYRLFRKDRTTSEGGGVAIFVRKDIMVNEVDLCSDAKNVDIICLDLLFSCQSLRIILCYRPPYYSNDDFLYLQNMLSVIDKLNIEKHRTVIMGDFNFPSVDWNYYSAPHEKCYDLFVDFVNDNGLQQHVFEPTRNSNILDLVFTNTDDIVSSLSVAPPFSTSDHNIIKFSFAVGDVPDGSVYDCNYYFDFQNADYSDMMTHLASIDWYYEFSFLSSVEEYWNLFKMYVHTAIEKCVPKKNMPATKIRNRKCYPRHIKSMLNRKAFLWKRWRISNKADDKQTYKIYALKCKNAFLAYQKNRELALIDKCNSGSFFRYVNNKISTFKEITVIKDNSNGKLISNHEDQANIFNKHFSNIFTTDDGKFPNFAHRTDDTAFINSIDFSVENVRKTLLSLKSSVSVGPDGIPNIVLRKLAHCLCVPLSYIFDASFSVHCLPSDWLQAIITPIFKKGSTSDPNNYRPISLTCTSCRVMERVINSQLINYLLQNKLISPHQHGFLKKHSTCTNLLETTNDWILALDNFMVTDVVYIDFQKAFDMVSHPKLLSKLTAYNIKDDLFDWIKSFLSGRTQQVKIKNTLSHPVFVTSGVPQGSCLGPTLFLLYINDLADCFDNLQCTVKLYADDAKFYSSYRLNDKTSSVDLGIVLERLAVWADTWQMQIAHNKSFVHRISTNNVACTPSFQYDISGTELNWSTSTRDLGITLDNSLKFEQHISNIVHNANVRATLILRSFISRDPLILTKAFITYVRPLLEYCTPVWSPHNIGLIKKVESVQRKFTKKLHGFTNIDYLSRLEILNLELLHIRRLKQDLVCCNGFVSAAGTKSPLNEDPYI